MTVAPIFEDNTTVIWNNQTTFDPNLKLLMLKIMKFYSYFFHYFVSWFAPILMVTGLTGTILCLVVLIRQKTTQPEIKCWFIALSIVDITSLITGLTFYYLGNINYITNTTDNLDHLDPRTANKFGCYTVNIILFYLLLASTWIQAGISIIRVVSSRLPLRTRHHSSFRNAKISLVITLILGLVISCTLTGTTFELSSKNDTLYCHIVAKYTDTFFAVCLVLRVIMPIICLSVTSILIIRSLRNFTKTFKNDGFSIQSQSVSHRSNGHQSSGTLMNLIPSADHSHSQCCGCKSKMSQYRSNRYQRRVSYILLGMNLAFVLTVLPYEVYKTVISRQFQSTDDDDYYSDAKHTQIFMTTFIGRTLNLLVYVNNATNWIFYFLLGKRFRIRVFSLLPGFARVSSSCRKGNKASTGSSNVSGNQGHAVEVVQFRNPRGSIRLSGENNRASLVMKCACGQNHYEMREQHNNRPLSSASLY